MNLTADFGVLYYNYGLGKMTNIKPGFWIDWWTWRPALVIFLSATAQNNAPQYHFTAVIKFYEKLPSQLDPPKIKNLRAITPTVCIEVVKPGRNHWGWVITIVLRKPISS